MNRSVKHGIDTSTSGLDAHAAAFATRSSGPASVDEEYMCAVLLKFLLQEIGILQERNIKKLK